MKRTGHLILRLVEEKRFVLFIERGRCDISPLHVSDVIYTIKTLLITTTSVKHSVCYSTLINSQSTSPETNFVCRNLITKYNHVNVTSCHVCILWLATWQLKTYGTIYDFVFFCWCMHQHNWTWPLMYPSMRFN